LRLERPARSVAWSSVDVDDLARDGYPPPLLVDVRAGEILYLPALWHHRVSQRRGNDGEPCAAVNFWHDMTFDDRHACARFLDEARARFEVATDPTGPFSE
jgi:jumonji domain-containing protein 7